MKNGLLKNLPAWIKPTFWDQKVGTGPFRSLFNFRRIWKLTVLLTLGTVLLPILLFGIIDYHVTRKAIETENIQRVSRLVSNTRRTVSFFLEERMAALSFVVRDNAPEELADPERLAEILTSLKEAFGGFVDLGLINEQGLQRTYIGPYELAGKDYTGQEWYTQTVLKGSYISDVFRGFRDVPHRLVAIRNDLPGGGFQVVRATLDTQRFNELLTSLDLSADGDAFLINHQGVLQTPSRRYGHVLDPIGMPVPPYSEHTLIQEVTDDLGKPAILGYAYIEHTPYVLMTMLPKAEFMQVWYSIRMELMGALGVSIYVVILVILGTSTYLVNQIYIADQNRVNALHQVEYSNKMASIGRLAAGVAHEINNPLAIINEKAGLLKDLFTFRKEYQGDPKVVSLTDSIIGSVERCGAITKRLLSFARHMEVSVEPVDIAEVIDEVLGFLAKEAEYRSIEVNVEMEPGIPKFETDHGMLQQILLNLVNNAFAAMKENGRLDISAKRTGPETLQVRVADTGCGIPEVDLKRIFEPFFSTKKKKGGTGLGLSITYGIIQKLGGDIDVNSEVGRGTAFTLTLPMNRKPSEDRL